MEAIRLIGNKLSPVDARCRLAITLLFLTGLGINELLQVKFETVKNIFENKRPYINITRIKGGGKRETFFLSKYGNLVGKEKKQDYDILKTLVLTKKDSFFFQSKLNKKKTISREHFTKQINKLLKVLGEK